MNANSTLIPINQTNGRETVNARELHKFLDIGKDFSTWIKQRIEQYGFIEGTDYIINLAPQNGGASHGGHNRADYHISIDMAKELSMVERTAKGKQARQYFIDMERRAKAAPLQIIDLTDPSQLVPLLQNYAERTLVAEARLIEVEPKALAFDQLDALEGSLSVRPASKVLGVPEHKLKAWLQVNRWAFRQNGKGPLQGYVEKLNAGYIDHKHGEYFNKEGDKRVSITLMITPKGLKKLAHTFGVEGV